MKRIELRTGAVVASLLLCGVVASPARAQSDSESIAAARALGIEGFKLAEAGNCVEAEDKLTKAEKLHHAVTTQVRLGECQISRGKLVEGTENLQKVVREVLPANAPAAFTTAQERARKLLDETKPKIGKSKVTVKGLPEGATPKVTVDGAVLNNVMLDTDRPTDPGDHKVEVTAEGYLPGTASFSLKEGASEAVTVTMQKDPSYVPPAPAVVTPPPQQQQTMQPTQATPPPKPAEPPKRNWVPVIAAGGVGVVGLGVWTGFGLAAMGQKSDLDSACANQVCPASSKDKLDSAKTNATIASVGLGVGAAGLVTAVVLYFVTTPKAETSASATATVTPLVGPTSVGLSGTF
jgi:hypothetical protein